MSKYYITRTSAYRDNDKPHPDAVEAEVFWCDRRSLKSFDELKNVHWGKDWLKKGTDHKEHSDHISRLIPQDGYTIEIDDLAKWVEENGTVVLSHTGVETIPLSIEIYDDYRE